MSSKRTPSKVRPVCSRRCSATTCIPVVRAPRSTASSSSDTHAARANTSSRAIDSAPSSDSAERESAGFFVPALEELPLTPGMPSSCAASWMV